MLSASWQTHYVSEGHVLPLCPSTLVDRGRHTFPVRAGVSSRSVSAQGSRKHYTLNCVRSGKKTILPDCQIELIFFCLSPKVLFKMKLLSTNGYKGNYCGDSFKIRILWHPPPPIEKDNEIKRKLKWSKANEHVNEWDQEERAKVGRAEGCGRRQKQWCACLLWVLEHKHHVQGEWAGTVSLLKIINWVWATQFEEGCWNNDVLLAVAWD